MKDDDSSEQFHCNGGTYSFLGNPRPQLVVFLGIWVFYGLPWIAMAYYLKELTMFLIDTDISLSFGDKLFLFIDLVVWLPSLIVVVQVTRYFFKRAPKNDSGHQP
ncbi:hypothetical protein N9115_00615 [bacterium]|nr:hypothetical protein [Akkermansiaceae bacterium]MDA9337542.1 hypothetical protein [bacterium]MDA7863572.1 hypothetical protein [Akkermansiaceae bacterium]MDB4266260.1 hypothetical protein [bacterium]MDB4271500.1 hypothetical protein [Akkermansiaceae bacterium]